MLVDHDALVFATDDELVEGTHDLIDQGLVAGDLVLVSGDDHGLRVLREAWDDDPRITFTGQDRLYASPMSTIADLQRVLDREGAAGHRVRLTGPVPFDEHPRRRRAWLVYEALVDRAFAPYGLVSLCQYDTRAVTEDLVEQAHAIHGRVRTSLRVEPGGRRGEALLAELAAPDGTDPLELEPPTWSGVLTGPTDLHRLRAGLLSAPRDLVFAANEVATNALEHGRPPVVCRLHHADGGWLCVIADDGRGLRDPYAGVDSPLPGNPNAGGRGLWLARQLCDELTISTDRDGRGTTVRLRARD